MDTPYNTTGSYVAFLGLVAAAINHFFPWITLSANDITAVVTGAIIFIGIVKQMVDHKKLAVVAESRAPSLQ